MAGCRVMLVHNAYQQPGGEDSVVEAEAALLQSRGHPVAFFGRHNDEVAALSRGALAAQALWSPRTVKEFGEALMDFRADVVHVHNTFPLISPSVYWTAARAGVPVVQTLHNYRLLCPQAMFLRQGRVCEDCLGRIPWRGSVHGCYRDSSAQTAVVGAMVTLHRGLGTWRNKVTRYIALNEFCRRKFVEGGLPADKIVVKPNFVDLPPPPPAERRGYLFVGRLSPEKGLEVLLQAWASADADAFLRVAGDGPQAALLQGQPRVQALGRKPADGVREEMVHARALLMPSIFYEGFPRTLVEAFACGLPVIASRIGSLAELVEDGVTGLLFEPGNADDLARKLRWAEAHPGEMAEMERRARARYEAEFTAERNYAQLVAIYRDAMEAVREEAAA